jgi:phosphoenolpyruvate carboxylase
MNMQLIRGDFAHHAIEVPQGHVMDWAEQIAGIHNQIENIPVPNSNALQEVLDLARFDTIRMRGLELANYTGLADKESNRQKIRETIKRLLVDEAGQPVDAKTFELKLNQIYGAVTTGHPVFGMNPELAGSLARYFSHLAQKEPNAEVTESLESDLSQKLSLPHTPPTLQDERDQSFVALKNMHAVAREVEEIAIEIAQDAFPDEWDELDYSPISVATWIPFDWDGRKDVQWYDLMRERILLQTTMLHDQILPDFQSLREDLPPGVDNRALNKAIDRIVHTLELMRDQYEFYAGYDQEADTDLRKLHAKGAELVHNTGERITHPESLVEALENLLAQDLPDDVKSQVVLMKSRLKNHGITLAHPHFRINAQSVRAALSQHGKEGARIDQNEQDEALDEVSLPIISRMLEEVNEESSHLANLATATETIMKQMVFIRQIVDHVDSHSSNRFLIAEAHNATVVLAALYFAKKTGIESHVDISPLFEDALGVEDAADIVKKLLKNKHYVDYLKRDTSAQYRMGQWIAMQFGYSDVSRFDGTIQSGAYTEQAKGQIAKAIARSGLQDSVLADVVYVSFDTHGEGIGRGKNPVSFKDRLKYLSTRFFNQYAGKQGQSLKYEESFQGQDGYLQLGTVDVARSVVAQTMEHVVTGDKKEADKDPIYCAYKSESRAFFKTARQAHDALAHSPENGLLIDIFKNFLPHTGSRPVKRDANTGGVRSLPRAIQHNGTLQQLGLLSTVTYGIGEAIRRHPVSFENMIENSPEFRSRMAAVYHVMDLADLDVLRSYVQLYHPEYWRTKARQVQDPEREKRFNEIGERVRRLDYYSQLSSVVAKMESDFKIIQRKREQINHPDDPRHQEGYAAMLAKKQYNMRVAHGARFKACIDLFEKAVQIPGFSNRNGMNRGDMISRILRFDMHAIEELNMIFESAKPIPAGELDRIKPSTLEMAETDYSGSYENIIEPMQEAMEVIRKRASAPIMDIYCAVG